MSSLESKQLGFLDRGPYDLQIRAGSIFGLSGCSGSGKTLLLRAMADLEPHEGQLFLDGINSETFSGPEWRRKVGYLPAENLWWFDNVGQHFFAEVDAASLQALGLASEIMTWDVSRLSTGEKQRLAILRMLQNNPGVLLLDEPTASLDARNVIAVEEFILRYLQKTSAACVWVSHDAEQLARLSASHCEILPGGELRQLR